MFQMQITSQKTIETLTHIISDDYSRRIFLAAIPKSKSVEDISKECDIPLSTCYRRVHEMVEGGAVIVERIVVTTDGKKFELYRSAYRRLDIRFEGGQIVVDATVNEDISDKLFRMWLSMKWQQSR
jgi:DNA-binding Lrp family transcriptional regulator